MLYTMFMRREQNILVNKEGELLERALNALERVTGFHVTNIIHQPDVTNQPLRCDAQIQIRNEDNQYDYFIEFKNVQRIEALTQLRALWPINRHPKLMLAAPYITPRIAEKCRELNLPFVDVAGNAYLREPGLNIYVIGQKKPEDLNQAQPGRINTIAGLKLTFAILCHPKLLNGTYRELAQAAGIALGAVGPVIKELEAKRYIAAFAVRNYRVINPEKLVQEWTTFYPTTLRPKLNARRFRVEEAEELFDRDLQSFDAYWGGEMAANRLTHYLTPAMFTIYVRHTPTRLAADLRLRLDVNGNVELLNAFWPRWRWEEKTTVPPLLAYADLMATTDGRNLEAARVIYEQHIIPHLRD
jgi:hypothetical protein